jgi:tagaturonate epimerase
MPEPANFILYPRSVIIKEGTTYSLEHDAANGRKRLVVNGDIQDFNGEKTPGGDQIICELTPENARVLRERLPWLKAVPLGWTTSAGMGDRLGLATPGHAAAVKGTGIAPIFAQQSVRENNRTGRTPQEVMDDAVWGLFQCGWRQAWGADADHLKKVEDLETFVKAGYTFFTVDPGDYVEQVADRLELGELRQRASGLAWSELKTSQAELLDSLAGKTFQIEDFSLTFDETIVLRAAVKYACAVAHASQLYRRLVGLHGKQPFDFEVSVDETATPTTIHEHFYIAHELKRLGVHWVSLAPRFVGKFEKGVDYIGDLVELDSTLGQHAAITRYFGSYKLSLHSGSDKFSVYPIAARHTGRWVHLKTAGTSYLEALRVIAQVDPVLFRKIYEFARAHYETDRASYHVSAELAKTPAHPSDGELPGLLDQFDARQVLHVTFGSVLDTFRPELMAVLRTHEDAYYAALEKHFRKHLDPLKP